MLVDLIEPIDVDEHIAAIVAMLNDGNVELDRIGHGMYRGGFQTTNLLESVIATEYPFEPLSPPEGMSRDEWLPEMMRRIQDETYPSDYGVVDYPEQILERFPRIQEDERPFILTFCEVRKDQQSDRGGWRWHKWGPYYGTQNPQCEYLYDEKDIDVVWTYAIAEVREGTYRG